MVVASCVVVADLLVTHVPWVEFLRWHSGSADHPLVEFLCWHPGWQLPAAATGHASLLDGLLQA